MVVNKLTQKQIKEKALFYEQELEYLKFRKIKIRELQNALQAQCKHPKGKSMQPGGGFYCPDCLFSN